MTLSEAYLKYKKRDYPQRKPLVHTITGATGPIGQPGAVGQAGITYDKDAVRKKLMEVNRARGIAYKAHIFKKLSIVTPVVEPPTEDFNYDSELCEVNDES